MFRFTENSAASPMQNVCACGCYGRFIEWLHHHHGFLSGITSVALLASLCNCARDDARKEKWEGVYAVEPAGKANSANCLDDDSPSVCH